MRDEKMSGKNDWGKDITANGPPSPSSVPNCKQNTQYLITGTMVKNQKIADITPMMSSFG
jgi:hypothetical protein